MAGKVPTSRLGQCCRCCGITVSFLISHIGLCALVLAYAFAGAFLFHYLESPHEQLIRNDTRVKRQQLLSVLWKLNGNNSHLVYEEWILKAHAELLSFETDIIHAVKHNGYNGEEDETQELQWSLAGAMMYSIIVITTIGYGNLAPKTTAGRIVTMLYAIAGIPLLRLFLSEVGDFMADAFKFLFWKICYKLCIREKHQNRHRLRRQPHYRRTVPDFARSNSLPMTPISQHSPILSSRSTPMSETPISEFADVSRVPIICNKYAQQSDVPEPTTSSSLGPRIRTRSRPVLPPLDITCTQSTRHFTISPEPPQVTLFHASRSGWDSDSDSSDDREDEDVPIVMCMVLVLAYICGGAWLFRQWEVDWSYLDSAYFCFVTLTTIGFGDMVPAAVLVPNTNEGRTTLIICALYLLFGMALLAMSFNVMQEAVSKSIKSTVRKVRLISFLETARRREAQRRSRRAAHPPHFLPP